jgi:heme oxygenase
MAQVSWMVHRLNVETRVHHPAADSDLQQLYGEHATRADYVRFLIRVYGFEAPLESTFAMTPGLDELVDLRGRARTHLIAADLMQLGLGARQVAELPQCLTIPQFRGAAEALGWMYVVERATLSHAVLRRHLSRRLPGEMQAAAAYLRSSELTVGRRWRTYADALESVARVSPIADRIVTSANDAFRCQRHWTTQGAPEVGSRAAG